MCPGGGMRRLAALELVCICDSIRLGRNHSSEITTLEGAVRSVKKKKTRDDAAKSSSVLCVPQRSEARCLMIRKIIMRQ